MDGGCVVVVVEGSFLVPCEMGAIAEGKICMADLPKSREADLGSRKADLKRAKLETYIINVKM